MTTIETYQAKCAQPSDINQLLPYIKEVASHCSHCTEFGVRDPTSTYALLAGCPNVTSYDIIKHPNVDLITEHGFKFVLGNTLKVNIEETDFLFIDTWHDAAQLTFELTRHADKARKYLGFHDIATFWEYGEAPYSEQPQKTHSRDLGLKYAIEPFLQINPEWKVSFRTHINNGLLILRRLSVPPIP